MTTTTLPRTTRPMDYLADALADHNRRHGGNADAAAHEVALVLAALAPDPGWINAVTDLLDRLGPNAPALAVEADDEADEDAVTASPFGLRCRVTFGRGRHGEARIGRTYNVPPLDVEIGAGTDVIAGLANAVYDYARPKLLSADIDVHVNPTPIPGTYEVTVYAGVAIGARATAVAQFPDDDEADEGYRGEFPPAHEYDGPHYDTPRPQS